MRCTPREPAPGELLAAGDVLAPLFEDLRGKFLLAGLGRLALSRWQIDRALPAKPRHFGACRTDGERIYLAARLVLLPEDQRAGIVAHELGHAADFLYPDALELRPRVRVLCAPRNLGRWKQRDRDQIEQDADQIAGAVLGTHIGYVGDCQLQALGRGVPRPVGLR